MNPGTTLGTYEIVSLIGAGGMGEVYQAHDTKLGRDVAIKVLPERFARDPERLARFQREAKMLAALNHPNIAAIYGLEQSNSTHYLVMELVPGPTLRERTAGGRPVPVEEALAIARQIAEALEAAHGSEKGIIHRDLKPANVKVLDFGLAKALVSDAAREDPANSPTLTALPTQQGLIMGTAAYMSPEQARGLPATKASDIWAFGCVLYELLTGKQAFQGQDVTEILAAVVMKEPAFDALPAKTPLAIRTLLRRCLRKDRRQRLQDATGIRIEIEEVLPAPAAEPASARSTTGWRRFLSWAAVLAVLALTAFGTWMLKPAPAPQPISRFTITLLPGERVAGQGAVALSPDGSRLAYVAARGGTQQIYLRPIDSLEARPVPGTEGADNPFFSPDGQWLGFFAGGNLKKVSVNGGAAITVTATGSPRGASWSEQGTIIFTIDTPAPLMQVPDAGGSPQPVTRLEEGDVAHWWPELLPGGHAVLFSPGPGRVAVYSFQTDERRDSAGPPRPLFEGLYERTGIGTANYDVSADGQRFLLVKASEQEAAAAQINVALNWFEELKQRVPAGAN